MNENPTEEQLQEADELGSGFGLDVGDCYQLYPHQLARLIAHVRQQERKAASDDARLGAAVRPYFTSANSIPVERATIKRSDIADALIQPQQPAEQAAQEGAGT